MRLHQISTLQEHPLRDVPLVVLSRGMNRDALQQRLQADLARLSTNVVHVTVAASGHEIHLYAPDVTVTWIDVGGTPGCVAVSQPVGPVPRFTLEESAAAGPVMLMV